MTDTVKPKCIPESIVNYYDGNKFVDLTFDDVHKVVNQKTRLPGVYVYTNMETGNYYIGESYDVFSRLAYHNYRLKAVTAKGSWLNDSQSKYKEFRKYGEPVYLMGLIVSIENTDKRKALEKHMIEFTDAPYNRSSNNWFKGNRAVYPTLGFNIRRIRNNLGYTQSELADKTGITQTYISNLETDKISRPRRGTIDKIANALGVTLNELAKE